MHARSVLPVVTTQLGACCTFVCLDACFGFWCSTMQRQAGSNCKVSSERDHLRAPELRMFACMYLRGCYSACWAVTDVTLTMDNAVDTCQCVYAHCLFLIKRKAEQVTCMLLYALE